MQGQLSDIAGSNKAILSEVAKLNGKLSQVLQTLAKTIRGRLLLLS
jgi:hypothetical protein